MSAQGSGPAGGGDEEQARPILRVVKGDPTPQEVAALVSVVTALASGSRTSEPPRTSEWSAPHRRVRGTHRHGPGAWRASAR